MNIEMEMVEDIADLSLVSADSAGAVKKKSLLDYLSDFNTKFLFYVSAVSAGGLAGGYAAQYFSEAENAFVLGSAAGVITAGLALKKGKDYLLGRKVMKLYNQGKTMELIARFTKKSEKKILKIASRLAKKGKIYC